MSGLAVTGCNQKVQEDLPNILWIVSEDNSAYYTGCYGNLFASTPNIDRLAGDGFLYTHAYATCAVSAPSRNTIITGSYAASNGNEHMRSYYPKSGSVHSYPEYLHQAGYYCTNNSKTDYNSPGIIPSEIWDESSNKAHYKNRPEGKPFFAVFNLMTSHESSLHRQIPADKLRHSPDKVILAPYHPDTPEMRHDVAQYYDIIEDMDAQVGALLKELDESGLAENTIVMYYGDNGGVLARSKRFMYETGTQIPFIIRIPEKYRYLYPAPKPGEKIDRLINFADLAPTLLSIIGIQIPDYMQGEAFLGKQKTKDPQYTYMTRQRMDERYDLVRSVRDKEFRYIRNYMPFRITLQHVGYLFRAPSAQSWENAFRAGTTTELQSRYFLPKPVEELYDTENDPWEINNLAGDPKYSEVLYRMRKALSDWQREIKDAGLVPESQYENLAGGNSMYDYMHSEACPFESLLEGAEMATLARPEDLGILVGYLRDGNSVLRYWGATGLLILKEAAKPALPDLAKAAKDQSGAVAVLATEALYGLGEKGKAIEAYINVLKDTVTYSIVDRVFAMNSIDAVNAESQELSAAVSALNLKQGVIVSGFDSAYEVQMSEYLLKKWGAQNTSDR